MSCSDYPTQQTAKTFKLDAETQHEVITSENDRTSEASDGKTKLTLKGIENLASDQRADIQYRADAQFNDIENTFTAQFAYKRVDLWDNVIGNTLTDAERLNSYIFTNPLDNSDAWYGPVQSQAFPIVIPADPSNDVGWVIVDALTTTGGDARYTATFKNDAHGSAVDNMIAGRIGGFVNVIHKTGAIYSTGGTSWRYEGTNANLITMEDFRTLTPVHVKDFGAIGDGIADDSHAFIAAWIVVTTIQRTESKRQYRTLKASEGTYRITDSFLQYVGDLGGNSGNYLTIDGEGWGSTHLRFETEIYNQELQGAPTLVGVIFQNIALYGTEDIDFFRIEAVAGSATQAFRFINCVAEGGRTFMHCGGTANADYIVHMGTRFSGFLHILKLDNYESLLHYFYGCEVLDQRGDGFITLRGGSIAWYGGGFIFRNHEDECAIVNLGGDSPSSPSSGQNILISGLRAELRGENSRIVNCLDDNVVQTLVFQSCLFNAFHDQAIGNVAAQNNSNIKFDSCSMPYSASGNHKIKMQDNPTPSFQYPQMGSAKSRLEFENCTQSGVDVQLAHRYVDWSELTLSDLQTGHVVEYKNCTNIPNITEYGNRYGSGNTNGTCKVGDVMFSGYIFPHGDGTSLVRNDVNYFNLDVPRFAFISSVTVKRSAVAAHSTVDYVIQVVDEEEYLNVGTGRVFGSSPVQKFNVPINWTVDINERFEEGAKLYITISDGAAAVTEAKLDIGVVFASIY
ncbi:pectin lyase fold protein [Vibrio phage 1.134.O._10N.222.52.B8]|nr:pectin lyase fold protein [Vibrio phage 1.134.O._10N.222.52.B8]